MTTRDIQIDNENGGFFLYDANEPDTAPALARRIPTEADAKRFAAVDDLIDALKAARQRITHHPMCAAESEFNKPCDCTLGTIRAALAKAGA